MNFQTTDRINLCPLRFSLFPNVPPYIRILAFGETYDPPLPQELSHFTWNAPSGISPIIQNTVTQSGFTLVQGQCRKKEEQQTGAVWDCLPITEKSKDEINFAALEQEVKINQFPGLFIIGRKDNLWRCFEKMRNKFGNEHFDFLPTTFILPGDKNLLVSEMKEKENTWIVKPPNWFCGIGISLINSLDEIPEKKSLTCVQEYITNPFLIRGLKFDLRIYLLLTSIDPIRLYIYEDGLVRFATMEYNNNPLDIKNNFIHLTNFSVNKNNKDFIHNECPGKYEGHKWNLKTLWTYFEEELGLDWKPIWEKTKEICLKTILCGHEHMSEEYNKKIKSNYTCYKLFGFDVFFDDNLKPWILEVNNIPSLHTNTIDSFVNYPMAAEMLNIVGFQIPKQIGTKYHKTITEKLNIKNLTAGNLAHNSDLYSRLFNERDLEKRNNFVDVNLEREDYRNGILDDLTPKDIRMLIQTEDEMSQTKNFTRIFPANKELDYLKFLNQPSYNDRLLDAWMFKFGSSTDNRLKGLEILQNFCKEKSHLDVPPVILRSSKSSRYDFTSNKKSFRTNSEMLE